MKIREGKSDDAMKLVGRLRELDIEEMEAMGGDSPDFLLLTSWANTDMRWALLIDDRVECVFGCRTLENGIGIPWLLGSEKLPNKALVKYAN